MSDDIPDNQLVPMQTESFEMEDVFEENEGFDSPFDDPNASTGPSDDDGHSTALAILPHGDAAFAREVIGVEGYLEMTPGYNEQHEEVRESIEEDLQPETQSSNHADVDLEPEQQAQRTSHETVDYDSAMVDVPDKLGDTIPITAADAPSHIYATAASRSAQHSIDTNDSSSLFVPERGSPPNSPAPLPISPRLIAAPPRQTSTSAHPTASKPSKFAKIRDMQKRAQERKKAFIKHAAASQLIEGLDPETYLEAVTAGIRPPPGAYSVEVDKDEKAHREALAKFQTQKRYYEDLRPKNGGPLTFRQDVEWMKIQGAEQARLKKRQRDLMMAHEDDEQDLFPPVRNPADEQDEESEEGFYGENTLRKRRRGEKPRKQPKTVSLQEAELQAMRVVLEADEDVPKKKKRGSAGDSEVQARQPSARGRGSKSKTSRPRTKAASRSTAKGPRKTAKDKRELERATQQVTSLFNSNVFEQQAGMGAADQPVFQTRRKADALKELIASVPIQDKKQVRNDMNTLLQASKDFDGRGACKLAAGGNWLVRGMKTSLKGYQVLGTAFMRRRENDEKEPRGGLMADQMGLGKTLMMLGKCIQNSHLYRLISLSEHCELS